MSGAQGGREGERAVDVLADAKPYLDRCKRKYKLTSKSRSR